MELKQLYKETILEHNRNPRNCGALENYTHKAEGLNAICGDQVFIYLNIEADVIIAISFDGESCAISRASCSLMTEFLTNKTTKQALKLFDDFCLLMDRQKKIDSIDSLQEINTMAGVKKFPARIKSATLCWYAMKAAVNGKQMVTTE